MSANLNQQRTRRLPRPLLAAMVASTESEPVDFEIEYGGKTYSASYVLEYRGVKVRGVRVTHPVYGERRAQTGVSVAELLAPVLLREILDDAKQKGQLETARSSDENGHRH